MIIKYTLTMPKVGSCKGYLFDKDSSHAICEPSSKALVEKVLKGRVSRSWHFNWKDGWEACVTAEVIDSKEARKVRSLSKGFFGYEWMIRSIKLYDKILDSTGEKRHNMKEKDSTLVYESSTIDVLDAILQAWQSEKDKSKKYSIRQKICDLAKELGLMEELYEYKDGSIKFFILKDY